LAQNSTLSAISDTLTTMCNTCGDVFIRRQVALDAHWLLLWWECRCGLGEVSMRKTIGVK